MKEPQSTQKRYVQKKEYGDTVVKGNLWADLETSVEKGVEVSLLLCEGADVTINGA